MKKAILVVSFGTSYPEVIERCIAPVERAVAVAHPEYEARRAFTSGMIIRKLKSIYGIEIDDIKTALTSLADEGFDEVICVPTHIIGGFEYDKVYNTVSEYADKMKIKITKPLLHSSDAFAEVIDALNIKNDGVLHILVGHGTEHESDLIYSAFEEKLWEQGFDNVLVGTVEGYSDLNKTLENAEKTMYKSIILSPLMLVAGEHAKNDISVEWKNAFEKKGFSVKCDLRGLGEYEAIQKIYSNF